MLVSIQRFIVLYSYSANEHFLHAYYTSGMDLDPEGNAKNREGKKRQISLTSRSLRTPMRVASTMKRNRAGKKDKE